ncbi:MAG: DUF971 domain-containing protein [Myxococcales bacterium]|nr:DUF971 domain-containing protein [Myxococcales bacterium]
MPTSWQRRPCPKRRPKPQRRSSRPTKPLLQGFEADAERRGARSMAARPGPRYPARASEVARRSRMQGPAMNVTPAETAEPRDVQWTGDGRVHIEWIDGHTTTLALALLRERCPCAGCKGTHGPPTTLVRASRSGLPIVQGPARAPVAASEVRSVVPVGNYAIRFTWGDGHDSGIYSWRLLRALCGCPACAPAMSTAAPVGETPLAGREAE